MNPNWSESRESRVQLYETPSGEAVFEDFLRYMYTGKILLDFATVIPLVSLADKYDVRDLLRIGLDFMERNVSTACLKNRVRGTEEVHLCPVYYYNTSSSRVR